MASSTRTPIYMNEEAHPPPPETAVNPPIGDQHQVPIGYPPIPPISNNYFHQPTFPAGQQASQSAYPSTIPHSACSNYKTTSQQQPHDHLDDDETPLTTLPISVVGKAKQFCVPHSVDLTLTPQTDNLSYIVFKDLNRKVVLHIKCDELSIFHSRVFLLDTDRKHLLTIQEKLMSTNGRWQAFKGYKSQCLLFSAKYTYSSTDPTKLLDVFLATNIEEEVCDFKVRGSWLERTCTFYTGDSNRIIAQVMHNKPGQKHEDKEESLNVTVYPETDYAFIAALIVMLAAIHGEQKEIIMILGR